MSMRILSIGVLIASATAALFTLATAEQVPYSVLSDGKPVLQLKLPNGCEAETKGDKTVISDRHQKPKFEFQLWVVENKKTVNDAVAGIGDVIKSEFLDLKIGKMEDTTVAGVPARHIFGSGTEADDGDPGNAEAVVFAVGGRVFIACVHGEGEYALNHSKAMLDLLQSAKVL